MMSVRTRGGGRGRVTWAIAALLLAPAGLAGQELADFDYENLSFRGFGAEWGYQWASRVEPAQTLGLRMDLGYLGPGLRIVPSIGYWKSAFKVGEIRELEDRVASLIIRQTDEPAPEVDLGQIDWSDVVLNVDAQVVWRVPQGFLTHVGTGAAVHLMNGDGGAINGTFVEDLLDSVTAGFNLHTGVEYLLSRSVRLYGQGRLDVLGDLRYYGFRLGGQIMLVPPAPGEERAR